MRVCILVFLIAFMAGCASGINVRADVDPSADFSQYKTYGFVQPLGTDVSGYTELLTQRIERAVRREMDSRGFGFTQEDPDLLLNFHAHATDKIDVDQVPVAGPPVVGYYGYRVGLYNAWPAYTYETRVHEYTEGTLNIDVVDRRQQRMVWEGVGIGRIGTKAQEDPQGAIDRAVAEVFAKFPVSGAASPVR